MKLETGTLLSCVVLLLTVVASKLCRDYLDMELEERLVRVISSGSLGANIMLIDGADQR
jgi:hypothetical protein